MSIFPHVSLPSQDGHIKEPFKKVQATSKHCTQKSRHISNFPRPRKLSDEPVTSLLLAPAIGRTQKMSHEGLCVVVPDADADYVFVPHAFRYKGTYRDDIREQEVYEQDAGSWIPIESPTSTTASIRTMSCARKQQLMETATDGSSDRLSEWAADPADPTSGSECPAKPAGGFTRMASVAAKARLERAAARERARATTPARERWAMSSSWSPRDFRQAVQQSAAIESPL